MAKRRRKGEGTIYKRGKGYAGLLPYTDPATGEQERMYFSGPTEQSILDQMEVARVKRYQGVLTADNKILFSDWIDTWLDDYQKPSIKESTYIGYKYLAKSHVKPGLGKLELSKITTTHLQKFYNTKLESGRADDKPGGLSPQTIHHMHKVIRGSLNQAVSEGKLVKNPADNVKLPRMKRKPIKPFNKDDVATFLEAIKGHWLYPVFMTAIGTGLRRGEVLGLKWKDIDLDKNTISIERELLFVNGKPKMQDDVKTGGSRRTVSMPVTVAEVLTTHKKSQKKAMLKLGHKLAGKDLVFTWESGELISPNYVYQQFKKLLVDNKLPSIRLHDLRHTFATLLLDAGVHPKIVADMLGHSTIKITLDTYSHTTPGMQERAAAHLDEAFKAKPTKSAEENK